MGQLQRFCTALGVNEATILWLMEPVASSHSADTRGAARPAGVARSRGRRLHRAAGRVRKLPGTGGVSRLRAGRQGPPQDVGRDDGTRAVRLAHLAPPPTELSNRGQPLEVIGAAPHPPPLTVASGECQRPE